MTNKTTSAIDLVERLRRTEKRKSYLATNRTAPIIESEYDAPINPDGPEAADTITRLQAALTEATDALEYVATHNIDGDRPRYFGLAQRLRSSVGGE